MIVKSMSNEWNRKINRANKEDNPAFATKTKKSAATRRLKRRDFSPLRSGSHGSIMGSYQSSQWDEIQGVQKGWRRGREEVRHCPWPKEKEIRMRSEVGHYDWECRINR
jgi:hypothetical protein